MRAFFDAGAAEAERWRAKNPYYYQWIARLLQWFIPPGQAVLEVGSGLGDLVAAVQPGRGVGVDCAPALVALARRRHPQLTFVEGDVDVGLPLREQFDAIIASDLVGYLDDIQAALEHVRLLTHERSRLIITQYNRWWEPILHLGANLGFNQPKRLNNWLSLAQLAQLLELAGFTVVTCGVTCLVPKRLGGVGEWCNRTIGRLPGVRRLGLIQYVVARPTIPDHRRRLSLSIVLPVVGASPALGTVVEHLPSLGSRTEIILLPAADDAVAQQAANEAVGALAGCRALRVVPWDRPSPSFYNASAAVAAGVAAANGDLVAVWDTDSALPPQVLATFYRVVAQGKAEAVVGTRLVYPSAALTGVQRLRLRWFSAGWSWLCGQRLSDPICPTAMFWRRDVATAAEAGALASFGFRGTLALVLVAAQHGRQLAEVPLQLAPGLQWIPSSRELLATLVRLLRWYHW